MGEKGGGVLSNPGILFSFFYFLFFILFYFFPFFVEYVTVVPNYFNHTLRGFCYGISLGWYVKKKGRGKKKKRKKKKKKSFAVLVGALTYLFSLGA